MKRKIWYLVLLACLSVGVFFLAKSWLLRYKINRHIGVNKEIKQMSDMENNEGYWATLTYDYCFSGMYESLPWFEDKRGYGLFKISNKNEFVYCSTNGAFEHIMTKEDNFFFVTKNIPDTEALTIEGYIRKIPNTEQRILKEQAKGASGDYVFLNEDENTEYRYVLQIKDKKKERSSFIAFSGLMFIGIVAWAVGLYKLIKA